MGNLSNDLILPPSAETQSTPAASHPGCWTYALFAGAVAWIVTATVGIQVVAWSVDQSLLIEEIPIPWYAWPLISWGHGFVLVLVALPLAIWTTAPRFRAVYRTWALAIGYLFVLGLARTFPMTWNQPAALAQIVLSLITLAGLLILARVTGRKLRSPKSVRGWLSPLAVGLALVIILPSVSFGALGSPLDALLNLLAGFSLGLFAGTLLDMFLFQPLSDHSSGPGRDIALGGLAAAVALFILGAGFGFNGSQLLLMISLPPVGLVAAGLGRLARTDTGMADLTSPTLLPRSAGWLPFTALVGIAAAAPLMFVDPEELTLLLGNNEILSWALRAAEFSLLIALVIGLVLWALRNRITGSPHPGLSFGALIATSLASLLIYFFAGQPGFYGEQLFVILHDQADLSQAASISNREDRLRYVYTTLTQHAETTQADLRATLDRLHIEYQPYYLLNSMQVKGGPFVRAFLSTRPEVDRILDSPHLRPLHEPVPVSTGDQPAPASPPWNITFIGADRVWTELGVTGKGIVVGQSDSGVDSAHPALRDGYRGRDGQNDYNWLDPWNHTRKPTDIDGHGTHTLGSAVGQGGIGVAPGAEWFGCVNLARNLGDPPWYLNCMQFMLAPYPQDGNSFKDGDPARAAHIINNSWGCPPIEGCDANSLAPAVNALRAAGIFVVASAGNEGPRCDSVSDPLPIYASAFSVGAIDKSGNIAFFSSRGPVTVDGSGRIKPDMVAPGVDILSAFPKGTYTTLEGTSMAGPHVVGVVALMWSAQPKLIGDIEQTQQILDETAQPYTGPQDNCSAGGTPNNTSGYGIVDAYAAVKAALAIK